MQCIEIREPGAPEVLQLASRPDLQPGPGQVLIEVAAAGVNRLDCLQRAGHYPPPPGAPDIPGLEVAGHIVALGAGVQRWQVGDAVCALLSGGGYASQALAEADLCLPVPEGWSLMQAAAVPEAAFTVWSMVWQRCALQPGESLLVQGGTSGIGSFAVQLARALGHPVLATAGGVHKTGWLRQLGVEHAIDYQTEDFVARTLELTGGRGVDVVLDMVGGPYLARHVEALAVDGRLAIIAFLGGARGELSTAQLLRKRLTVTASTLRNRDLPFKAAIARALQQQVWPLLHKGAVRPCVQAVLPLADAAQAHRLLEQGGVTGKLVLAV